MRCANCNIEIRWQPTIVDGKYYCCWGCANGGPCTCDYTHLPQAEDPVELAPWKDTPLVVRTDIQPKQEDK